MELVIDVDAFAGQDGNRGAAFVVAFEFGLAVFAFVDERMRGFHLVLDLRFDLLERLLVLPQLFIEH